MIKVFIGSDPRQPVAFQVAAHSVWSRSSKPVSITRLQLNQLPITRRGLTEFTYSRFLVPYLCDYEGYGIFMDADVLMLGDVDELLVTAMAGLLAKKASVAVVPHEGKRAFERASMMVFDCSRCLTLTPEWIEDTKNNPFILESWAKGIAHLPIEYNQLVGYSPPNANAKLIHYTMGIPCWPETKDCEFANEWRSEVAMTVATVSYADLMGKSVHDQHVKAGVLAKTGS